MALLDTLSPKSRHIIRHGLLFALTVFVGMTAYEWFFEDGIDWPRHLLIGAIVYLPIGWIAGWFNWRTHERLRIERETLEREDEEQRLAALALMESRKR